MINVDPCPLGKAFEYTKLFSGTVIPDNRLSPNFRASAEVACAGYTTLCHLSYAFVFPCVRSSALMPPAFIFSVPGCESTAVSQRDHVLTIAAHTPALTASGPRCGISSCRIHSYDTRRPRDLPLWAYAVRLVLCLRRFRCLHASCTTQTFAARLPQVVRPSAPRTVRLTAALQHLGLALGGEAGAGGHAPSAHPPRYPPAARPAAAGAAHANAGHPWGR
jgi:hypothetical protein